MIDNRFAPYGAFTIRAALGIMFIAHAYLKIAVFTVPGFAGFLGQMGYPTFLAWPIILAELFGGLAILTGFYARIVEVDGLLDQPQPKNTVVEIEVALSRTSDSGDVVDAVLDHDGVLSRGNQRPGLSKTYA